MKRLIPYLVGLSLVGSALASPLQFTDASIQTNGASVATLTPDDYNVAAGSTGNTIDGWLDAVIIDITAGSSDTNTITLSTLAGEGTGASRTLLTLSNVSADGTYPVRDLVVGTTGSDITTIAARHALQGDKLRLTAVASGDDTNAVAATMTVYIIMSPVP